MNQRRHDAQDGVSELDWRPGVVYERSVSQAEGPVRRWVLSHVARMGRLGGDLWSSEAARYHWLYKKSATNLPTRAVGWLTSAMAGLCLVLLTVGATFLAGPVLGMQVAGSGAGDGRGWQGYQSFLDVKQSEIRLRAAEAVCERSKALHELGLTSQWELDRDEAAVETARLDFQSALLDAYALKPRVVVRRAVKLAHRDGTQKIRLTLENVTPAADELDAAVVDSTDAALLPPELRDGLLRNVYVSLQAPPDQSESGSPSAGTTIALPYELLIEELEVGVPRTVELSLLRDVSSVMVVMELRGARRTINVELEQELGGNATLSSTHLSQEQELGSQAQFSLDLDRARTGAEASFWLRVVNLPPSISASFVHPGSGARLTQVRLPAGVRRQELDLTLYLPERAGGGLTIDQAIPFWALACEGPGERADDEERLFSVAEVAASGCASVSLELVPRGRGKIEVEAAHLYFEANQGDELRTTMTVKNTGSRRVVNLGMSAEAPLRWKAELSPENVPILEVGQETTITLAVAPPADAPVGEYEVRVRPTSFVGNKPLATETKTFRVGVRSGTSLVRSAGLLLMLLTVVGAVVYTAVKHSRR